MSELPEDRPEQNPLKKRSEIRNVDRQPERFEKGFEVDADLIALKARSQQPDVDLIDSKARDQQRQGERAGQQIDEKRASEEAERRRKDELKFNK